MARKAVTVFSLSFLDAMTCGLGAVVLLFMIINANIDERREVVLDELASEVDRMELQVLVGRKNLVQIQQELAELIQEWAILRGLREEIITEISLTAEEFSTLTADTTA
ncbi:MAG: VWA domain-containing protein, partial [Gammaproteobacteria bacterium]|nr:VWA domain-containing protein [Gammaproteobacteria bacterium]